MLSCHGLFSPTSCPITTMLIDDTECISSNIITRCCTTVSPSGDEILKQEKANDHKILKQTFIWRIKYFFLEFHNKFQIKSFIKSLIFNKKNVRLVCFVFTFSSSRFIWSSKFLFSSIWSLKSKRANKIVY